MSALNTENTTYRMDSRGVLTGCDKNIARRRASSFESIYVVHNTKEDPIALERLGCHRLTVPWVRGKSARGRGMFMGASSLQVASIRQ